MFHISLLNYDNVDDDYDNVMAVAAVHVVEVILPTTTAPIMMMNAFIFNRHFAIWEECILVHLRRLVLFDFFVF